MATAFTKAPCTPPPKVKKPLRCPDCGALECLCRPRFFAGQLLSEQDLNRLDQYIKKKHQLHNHNLHGFGVVNGLKVVCDPCGHVVVTEGYAIDACGDDIVVCEDTAVNVCDLIRKCKESERDKVDCRPFSAPGGASCEDIEEEWVLAIKYVEWPSRGITALRGGGCEPTRSKGTCGCVGNCSCAGGAGGCSCGGSRSGGASGSGGSSGCGCGQPGNGVNGRNNGQFKPRGAPAECEPTILCEGYAFDLYRKPEPEDPPDDDDDLEFGGAVADAFRCCMDALNPAIPTPPGDMTPESLQQQPHAWHQWCCRAREGLIRYFMKYPTTNCESLALLHGLVCPNPNAPADTFAQQMAEVVWQLALIYIEAMLNCLCLALLPPAPEPTDDARVPLATIRVQGPDCKVLSICNWTVCRKFVTTWPTMCYWWSIVPISQVIREAMDRLCCTGFNFGDFGDNAPGVVAGTDDNNVLRATANQPMFADPAGAQARATRRLNPQLGLEREFGAVTRFMASSLAQGLGNQPLDAATLVNSVSRFSVATEDADLSRLQRRNLPQFLLINSVAGPLLQTTSKAAGTELGMAGKLMGDFAEADGSANAQLRDRIDALEARLAAQQSALDALQRGEAADVPPGDDGGRAPGAATKKARSGKKGSKKTGKK